MAPEKKRSKLVLLLVLLTTVVTMTGVSMSRAGGRSESEVKAAFLINFIRFVEWPEDKLARNEDTIVVGLVGDNRIRAALESIRDKRVKNRRITIRTGDPKAPPPASHVLFVSEMEEAKVKRVLRSVSKGGVLTVGESDDFLRQGGIIRFVKKKSRIRFEINPGAAKQAGLSISSKLLRLALVNSGKHK